MTLSADATAIVLIFLVVAAVLSLAMILAFNRDALRQYYKTALTLGGQGIITSPELVPGGGAGGALEGAETPTTPLTITGSASAVIGVATEYKASVAATWTVAPDGAGAINPKEGEEITFTPAKVGIVTLKATKGTSNAEMEVVVLEPSKTVKLPFVGKGYGTIAIGIVAIFVVFGLGITGRLDPAALATLFGGLLGVGAARVVTSDSGGSGGGAAE